MSATKFKVLTDPSRRDTCAVVDKRPRAIRVWSADQGVVPQESI
jgi:hypothetical protein